MKLHLIFIAEMYTVTQCSPPLTHRVSMLRPGRRLNVRAAQMDRHWDFPTTSLLLTYHSSQKSLGPFLLIL